MTQNYDDKVIDADDDDDDDDDDNGGYKYKYDNYNVLCISSKNYTFDY